MKISAISRWLPLAAFCFLIAQQTGAEESGGGGSGADSIDASGFVVIVNKANVETTLTRDRIAKLFLKKMTVWNDNSAVKPVDQSSKSETRKAFSSDVLKMSVDAVLRYWQQMVFSGRGSPPPIKNSDAAVIEYVKANPGAIGYVSKKADTSSVAVVTITD